MSDSATAAPVRFHLSLNVSDLSKAVAFFESVLGQKPAKQRSDYAKFELDSPPLVFSLEPRSPQTHGSLNHVGFRFPDAATLVDAQRRLEAAGVSTQREEGVECCYAKQSKFWVHDLDQRLWEFYILEGDLEHRGAGQTLEQMVGLDQAAAMTPAREPVVWEHRMYEPFAPPAEPCDEIRLRGTFNAPLEAGQMEAQLCQAFDALAPGGKLLVHILTAEEPVVGELNLPGRAAYVKCTPVRTELLAALEAAGFADVQLTTFRSGACFEHAGQPLRETQIAARRPAAESEDLCTVVFKGPFQEVADDEGHVWRRGEPTAIPRSRWKSLQESAVADLFVELPEAAPVSHCGL